MSPVSRGRKAKKRPQSKSTAKQAPRASAVLSSIGQRRSALSALAETLGGPRERPRWFDAAIDTVLSETDVLMSADGPRGLDQAVAELLGAELYRLVNGGESGLWFDWWFEELAEAAMNRARDAVSGPDPGGWEPCWRLLHAMTGLGSPAVARAARVRLDRVAKAAPRELVAAQPRWLQLLAKITATGELWQMQDVYGGRRAVVAGFGYPGGVDRSVFLFDVDVCRFVALAGAGVFDDVEQAAAAWRAQVGETADGVRPVPVSSPGTLHELVHWDAGEETLQGDESREVLDNWFRARRRLHDLADALRKRRTPLPAAGNPYRDFDIEPMVEAFTQWHLLRHATAPDAEATQALAQEWLSGALPGTENLVAPERVAFFRELMDDDWLPDDPLTVAVKSLVPDWVRWNGEQYGLSAQLIERAVERA